MYGGLVNKNKDHQGSLNFFTISYYFIKFHSLTNFYKSIKIYKLINFYDFINFYNFINIYGFTKNYHLTELHNFFKVHKFIKTRKLANWVRQEQTFATNRSSLCSFSLANGCS